MALRPLWGITFFNICIELFPSSLYSTMHVLCQTGISTLSDWVLYSSPVLGCNGPAGRFAVSSGCPRDWQGELCARASQSLTVREGLECFVRRGPRIDLSQVFSLLRLYTPLPNSDFLSYAFFPGWVVCLILNSCILRISNSEFWSRLCSHVPPGISVCSLILHFLCSPNPPCSMDSAPSNHVTN